MTESRIPGCRIMFRHDILNVLSRADGIYIQDLEGEQYIDMHGNAVHNAGLNNPAAIAAVKKQLKWP